MGGGEGREPGLWDGREGKSKSEGSFYGATPQGLAWEVPSFAEGAEEGQLWAA